MKIGFDVSQTAENKAGCGFFADQLIKHVVEKDHSNEYLLYPVFYNYKNPKFKEATCPKRDNVRFMFADFSWAKVVNLWNNGNISRDMVLGFPDLIHSNNFCCPKDVSGKKVVTVYDMSFLDCPQFTTETNRILCFSGVFDAGIYADHIITISYSSKNAFLKYFPHYPEERVSVVYPGNRSTLSNNITEKVIRNTLRKFGIQEDFWLGVGTIEPRKNYELLLEAYANLVKNHQETRPLFIAGGKGWLESDIGKQVTTMGLKEKVKFLGYVTDEELSVLYSRCFAFVYPSFYEGFGLPVLEAMSCGAPVICSNTTSLPEIAGDTSLFIDPYCVESLIDAMNQLRNNGNLGETLRLKGFSHSKKFSWEIAADQVLTVYEKTMGMKPWFGA